MTWQRIDGEVNLKYLIIAKLKPVGSLSEVAANSPSEPVHTDTDTDVGSGIVLVSGVIAFGVVLAGILFLVGGYLINLQHARQGADLVALSAAQKVSLGQPGCKEVEDVAAANGVELAECVVSGDSLDFVISVRVARVHTIWGWRFPIQAEAHAGSVDT